MVELSKMHEPAPSKILGCDEGTKSTCFLAFTSWSVCSASGAKWRLSCCYCYKYPAKLPDITGIMSAPSSLNRPFTELYCRPPLHRVHNVRSLQLSCATSDMPRTSISSLGSSSNSSDDGYDSDEELRLAQQEWEENVRQLQLLVSVVLLPYVGKFLGRKWAHSGKWCILLLQSFFLMTLAVYDRYARLGWSRAFFFGQRTL